MDAFIRHLDAFTAALGVEEAPAIFAFSQIAWPDDDTRNQFIMDLTGRDLGAEQTYGG